MECNSNECIICNKEFSNTKAMGGHMRSHYAMHPPPSQNPPTPQPDHQQYANQSGSTLALLGPTNSNEERVIADGLMMLPEGPRRPKRNLRSVEYHNASRVQVRRSESYPCKVCKQRIGSLLTFGAQEANHNGNMAHYVHKCEVCGRIFETSQGLGRHRWIHVPKVADMNNDNSIDVPPPKQKPRLMIDLNEPPTEDESDEDDDDEVPDLN